MKGLQIGADPEFFLKKNGMFHSGVGLVPGDKANPSPVDKGAVQVDGMAVEFNITPASTRREFRHNIATVMASLRDMIPPEYDFSFESVAQFEEEHMASMPAEALVLGCDPDFNGYTETYNEEIADPGTVRVAGGHVHLGWGENFDPKDPNHFATCCRVARQLDFTLGILGTMHDPKDVERKKMYGKPASFRPKSYGMEYRSLSSFWLETEELMGQVYSGAHFAFDNLKAGNEFFVKFGNAAKDVMNSGSRHEAVNLYDAVYYGDF